ncbi:MAG: ABC-F type ribosomal protection protein [Provencibacterium sp.]|jgi:lincosamide and streptogramin A transport system ATP-binding/permease protein|nr:ABC-F type ribosomal protection protein [Provencibacterium sp.]
MSLIEVSHLTFSYEGSYDNIFEDASFSLDTDWKLGFIGRNGRGKTTFLRLLMGELLYSGRIAADLSFDYFPFSVAHPEETALTAAREAIAPFARLEREKEACLARGDLEGYGRAEEEYLAVDGYCIDELIQRECGRLRLPEGVLDRPFCTLSGGERTKVLLAALFLRRGRFLLIDEPTNHLDSQGRRDVGDYLASKKGFILVSHDRAFLDRSVDHILSLNRQTIEVQQGNYSSFEENRRRRDQFELAENERLKKDIGHLQEAARQKAGWSDRIERGKIGEHSFDRGYIGHKSAKMMARAKSIERRQERALEQKQALLKDLEEAEPLTLHPLKYPKERLIEARGLSISFDGLPVFEGVDFTLRRGERVALVGPNGSGKSSVLKLCCGEALCYSGFFSRGSGLAVSYVSQDTSFLSGALRDFIRERELDEPLFKAILRKLDFSRLQFEKDMADYSGGQKKKVLLAASLASQAHLYIWDEPLNFIDLDSRMQIEEMLQVVQPTMLFVEHDAAFTERIATRTVALTRR